MENEASKIELPQRHFSLRTTDAPAQASPDSLLHAITIAASNPAMDIEKMERLFAMHERLVKAQAEQAFNAAMARAQAAIEPITRNKMNTHTQSWYADLAAINEAIVPIYTAEGLSVTFDTETQNDADPIAPGTIRVTAIVGHAAGFSRRYHMDLIPDGAGVQGRANKTGVQASGSTNTYGRRYLIKMIFNIADEDNDGNADTDTGRDASRRKEAPSNRVSAGAMDRLDNLRQDFVIDIAEKIKEHYAADDIPGAYALYFEVKDADERVALQHMLPDSKLRAAMNKHGVELKRQKEEAAKQEALSKLK